MKPYGLVGKVIAFVKCGLSPALLLLYPGETFNPVALMQHGYLCQISKQVCCASGWVGGFLDGAKKKKGACAHVAGWMCEVFVYACRPTLAGKNKYRL